MTHSNYSHKNIFFILQQEILIPGVSPSKVIDFVGDWNNHKNLNPHILAWRIEDREVDSSDKVNKIQEHDKY